MTLQLFNDYGDPFEYSKLSERLPQFLEKYPASDYSVITEMTDMLSLMPGTLSLLEKAPTDGELSSVVKELAGRLVCRASLLDKEGRVVQTASASGFLDDLKSYEILETAARQRLVAACGYAGDHLDVDEHLGFKTQGITEQAQTIDELAPIAEQDIPKDTTQINTVSANVQDEQKQDMPTGKVVAKKLSTDPVSTTVAGESNQEDGNEIRIEIPASMIRQIESQAKLKKVSIPKYTDLASAKAALSHLYGLPRTNATA